MITSNNYTEYGIHRPEERCFWIIYLLIVLLSSLMGSSIILIASVKYRAIKLNILIVVVMEHIALSDILTAVSCVLPTLISMIANKWVLGSLIAHVHVYLCFFNFQVSNMLICTLTSVKLMMLMFPFRIRTWTKNTAHIICGVVWSLANIFPGLRFIFDRNGLVFNYVRYNIDYGTSSEFSNTEKSLIYWSIGLTVALPIIIVLITSIGTFVYLVKSMKVTKLSRGKQRWQGIVTVFVTGTVFCISSIPLMITFALTSNRQISNNFTRISENFAVLNIMSNFYIYVLAIPSFRNFITASRVSAWIIQRFILCRRYSVQSLIDGHQSEIVNQQPQTLAGPINDYRMIEFVETS